MEDATPRYSTDGFHIDTDTVQSDSEDSGHRDEAEADRITENGIRVPASANTAAVRGVDRGGGRYGRTAGQGTSAMSGTVPSGSSVGQDKGRGAGAGADLLSRGNVSIGYIHRLIQLQHNSTLFSHYAATCWHIRRCSHVSNSCVAHF